MSGLEGYQFFLINLNNAGHIFCVYMNGLYSQFTGIFSKFLKEGRGIDGLTFSPRKTYMDFPSAI